MGLTSLQVCMDSSDWFQGAAHEERASGSTSPPSGEMMTCSKVPLVERRLRPPHEQVLKCPRCDSTHTKFCYYNNYSLSQPRYFCKTCRRYWTKGGTLRNVPVGGGCRKNNKKVSASTSNKKPMINQQHPPSHLFPSSSSFSSLASTDLHLSFSGGLPFSHLNYSFLENADGVLDNQCKYGDTMLGNLDGDTHVTDSKLDLMMAGSSAGYYSSVNIGDGFGAQTSLGYNVLSSELHGPCCTPFGFTMDYGNVGDHHGHGSFSNGAGLGERLLLPFGGGEDPNAVEVKPSNSVLALESHGHHQACSDQVGKDSSMGGGYPVSGGIGAWSGVLNGGFVSSTTANQLM